MLYFLRISFRTSLLFYNVKRIKHISFRRIYRNGINLAKGHQKSSLTTLTMTTLTTIYPKNPHTQKVRVKVCNHPFTLNFLYYICVHLYLFPTAPAVKTIELFANRNISKRESNNNYTNRNL